MMDNWIYWIAASGVFAAIFIVFRIIVKKDYQEKGRLGAFAAVSQWILILYWVCFSWVYLDPGDQVIQTGQAIQVIAWVLIVAGLLFFFYSFIWLGIGPSHGIDSKTLKMSGPYRFFRNPQIVGFIPAMIGFVLLWPSWHMFVSLVLMLILSHTMVITEEEHLLNKFGEEYRTYCKKTPRYLFM